MKARIRKWRYEAQQETLDREHARLSWEAWDAHAARGDTFNLRKEIAAQVSEVLGITCTARLPIRHGKYDKAKGLVRKLHRQRRRPKVPAPPVPEGFPW
jgi:hypothetical protein